MAIYQIIRTLSLDEAKRLTTAYEDALRALQLSNRTDPITTIVAERIIEALTAASAIRRSSAAPQ